MKEVAITVSMAVIRHLSKEAQQMQEDERRNAKGWKNVPTSKAKKTALLERSKTNARRTMLIP